MKKQFVVIFYENSSRYYFKIYIPIPVSSALYKGFSKIVINLLNEIFHNWQPPHKQDLETTKTFKEEEIAIAELSEIFDNSTCQTKLHRIENIMQLWKGVNQGDNASPTLLENRLGD